MIKNERQYKISKAQLKKFHDTFTSFGKKAKSDIHPALIKAQKDAIKSQIDDLVEETDYASVSMSRLISITHALDLTITEDIVLPLKKH